MMLKKMMCKILSNKWFYFVTGILGQSETGKGCGEENLNREAYYHKSLVEFQTAIEIQIVAEPGWNRHSFSELPDIWLTFFKNKQ